MENIKEKFSYTRRKGQQPGKLYAKQHKGFEKIREVLNKKRTKDAEKNITKLTQVKSYANLTGTENIPITRVRGMLDAWNNFFLPAKFALSYLSFTTTPQG